MPDPTPIAEVIQSIYPPCKESPLCCYPPLQSGYCWLHEPRKEKVKKRIPKVAKKRERVNRVYRKQVTDTLQKQPLCVIKSPVCTIWAQGLNHLQKRSPSNITKEENQEPACNACNSYVENFPEWAKEHGHQISRFKTI